MMVSPQEEPNGSVCGAGQQLTQIQEAGILLNTALALIDNGREDVENCLDVYLKIPGLPEEVAKALFTQGKYSGEQLFVRAQQGHSGCVEFSGSVSLPCKEIRFASDPGWQRVPLEIWELIAAHIPRYHLRKWLFLSRFHRDIASSRIFHTIDIYFGEKDQDNLIRGLDIFNRVTNDPVFASRVKSLRLHWAYITQGEMWSLVIHILKRSLPKFKALQDFEWIGHPVICAEVMEVLQTTHKHLHGLGSIGVYTGRRLGPFGDSAFVNLHKFSLRGVNDEEPLDMEEARTVLDQNKHTLKHLFLGASLSHDHSWDLVFRSVTIKKLTQLDLVDTLISDFVLNRIVHDAHNLQCLTLHGFFVDSSFASVLFASDRINDGKHSLLPHLEVVRLDFLDLNDQRLVYSSVASFLRKREKLRRLDLGSCPWDIVQDILPDLMVAISLSVGVSDTPLNEYAHHFTRFNMLSFLHLQIHHKYRPKLQPYPNKSDEKEFQTQMEMWISAVRSIAVAIPWLDFFGWHGEHYIVVRSGGDVGHTACVEVMELPARRSSDCGRGVDLGGEDAAWLEKRDVPMALERWGWW